MTKLDQIENDVKALSDADLARFREWFAAYEAEKFDEAIDRDARSGALDDLADAALANHTAARMRLVT